MLHFSKLLLKLTLLVRMDGLGDVVVGSLLPTFCFVLLISLFELHPVSLDLKLKWLLMYCKQTYPVHGGMMSI